jgi:hypothetical protein
VNALIRDQVQMAGESGVLTDQVDLDVCVTDWRGRQQRNPLRCVRPRPRAYMA